ncbi:neprilysin-1-like [Dermacentor variabilis]|uniref:neprilysin-1-like n=1 Tax=Dermacentor variabilis TaxID=34621 RepID=UPI003F5C230E
MVMLTLIVGALLVRRRPIAVACTSPACHYYSLLLQETLNESTPPCADLYEHVCSRWDARHPYSVKTFVYNEFLASVASIMEDMTIPQSGRTAIQDAAMFYLSCTRVYADGKENVGEVKAMLQTFGILWPEWSRESNILRILSTVSAAWNWGSILLFDIPVQARLTIAPAPYFQFLVERHIQIEQHLDANAEQPYRSFFEAAVQMFALPGAERALSYYEHRNIESTVLSALKAAYDEYDWMNIENATLNETVDLAERAKPRDAWVQEISAAFNVSVDDSFSVSIENVHYFQSLFSLVRDQGESDLAYYVGWGVVQALSFMSSSILIRRYFATDDEARQGQSTFCAKLTNMYMSPALHAIYVRDEISVHVLADAEDTGRNIESVFRDDVNAIAAWRDALPSGAFSVAGLVDHLSTTRKADASSSDQEYEYFHEMGDNILNNMELAARRHRSIKTGNNSAVDMVVNGTVQLFYFLDGHVALHPIIFQEPLYSGDALPAITYGTLGAEVSYALATRLFDVVLESKNELRVPLRPILTCVFGQEMLVSELDSRRLEFLRRLVSVRAVFQAFARGSRAASGSPFGLHNYEHLSSNQLLFIFWCFVQCGSRDGKLMCNKAARLTRGFSGAFRCRKGSPMYAENDCPLFEKEKK